MPDPECGTDTTCSDQQRKLDILDQHILKWFHQPDLEAFRIALAVAHTNSYPDTDPVWLFIVGPSGCGKSALYIQALKAFEHTHVIGDLTVNTFLSGKSKKNSFLTNCGK